MDANLRKTLAGACAALLGAGAMLCGAALAAPVSSVSRALSGMPVSMVIRVARICDEPCPECTDCIPEIDVAPPADEDDPIAREIEKLRAPRAEICEGDRIVPGRRGTPDADACGIRCWYWRLRHGYCGPGCEYYRYRFHDYPAGKPGQHHQRYACRS